MEGIWRHKSGLRFEGKFYKERFHQGKFVFPDGDEFWGEWVVKSKKYSLKEGFFMSKNGKKFSYIPGRNLYIPMRRKYKEDESDINKDKSSLKINNNTSHTLTNKSEYSLNDNLFDKSKRRSISPVLSVTDKNKKFVYLAESHLLDNGFKSDDDFSTQNHNIINSQINIINENNYFIKDKIESIILNDKPHSQKFYDELSDFNLQESIFIKNVKSHHKEYIKGKIFFADCSNGTSCVFVGDFKDPSEISTKNSLMVGISGFYEEFHNNSEESLEPNKIRVCQFSYSSKIKGAFFTEEEFNNNKKYFSRTLFYDGTQLMLFWGPSNIPSELKSHFKNILIDKEKLYGWVSFPYDPHLISILGEVKGSEVSFKLDGKAFFNNSLFLQDVEMNFQIDKKKMEFKIKKEEKTMKTLKGFVGQIQILKMKKLSMKPDSSLINGYHIYRHSRNNYLQGFFLNDHLIIHKNEISDFINSIDQKNGLVSVSNEPKTNLNFENSLTASNHTKTDPFPTSNVSHKKCSCQDITLAEITSSLTLKLIDLCAIATSKLCKNCINSILPSKTETASISDLTKEITKDKFTIPKYVSNLSDPKEIERIDFPIGDKLFINSNGFSFRQFKMENEGLLQSPPSLFIGEITDGKKQGYIIEDFDSEECYAGFYKNGMRDGFGKLYKYGKYFYEGQFKGGRKYGKGIISFESGEEFLAIFKNDKIKTILKDLLKQDKTTSKKTHCSPPSLFIKQKSRSSRLGVKNKVYSRYLQHEHQISYFSKEIDRNKYNSTKKKKYKTIGVQGDNYNLIYSENSDEKNLYEWIKNAEKNNNKQDLILSKESVIVTQRNSVSPPQFGNQMNSKSVSREKNKKHFLFKMEGYNDFQSFANS